MVYSTINLIQEKTMNIYLTARIYRANLHIISREKVTTFYTKLRY